MYNNEYEDYMRSILGYPIQNEMNTYNNAYENNNSFFSYRSGITYTNESDYDNLYPEIYKILKPMVRKVCNNPRYCSISNNTLEIMANEIYNNIEPDIDVINVNINTKEAEPSGNLARKDMSISQSKTKDEEARNCCGNPTLKDLIKIMEIGLQLDQDHHFQCLHIESSKIQQYIIESIVQINHFNFIIKIFGKLGILFKIKVFIFDIQNLDCISFLLLHKIK